MARKAGLFVPHLPAEYGGRGLGILGMCTLFREMGRSPVGARVFNCDAPDQGNMDLSAAEGQSCASANAGWGRLPRAEITSAFCMTEPAPGAGADPSNLLTRATRDGDAWRIDGHKWYSTGGGRASFLIVMARTSEDARTGASLFIVERNAPGVTHVRDIKTLGPDLLAHREAEFRFEGVRVKEDAILGEVGEGFLLAQARLIPARLTHCMRWLGLADRTLELCKAYLTTRVSFGKLLAQHQADAGDALRGRDGHPCRKPHDVALRLAAWPRDAPRKPVPTRPLPRPTWPARCARCWTTPSRCTAASATARTCPSPFGTAVRAPRALPTGRMKCTWAWWPATT